MTFYMAITNFGILHNLNLQTASYITIFLFAKQTILIYKLHNHHEKNNRQTALHQPRKT